MLKKFALFFGPYSLGRFERGRLAQRKKGGKRGNKNMENSLKPNLHQPPEELLKFLFSHVQLALRA